jgi:hypothetical protein
VIDADPVRPCDPERVRSRSLLLAVLFALLVGVPTAAAITGTSFENPGSNDTSQQLQVTRSNNDNIQRQDTPNDPNYDQAEPDSQNKTSNNIYDERFDLFGFASQYSPNARYLDPQDPRFSASAARLQVSGFNAAGAWKLERGRPDVVVAILDTGIKWDNAGLRTQVHLNKGELPTPANDHSSPEPGVNCDATYTHGGYDINGDGAFNVDDYACDSRISLSWTGRAKNSPANLITGEDVIHAFSDGADGYGASQNATDPGPENNGFVDDIAGWDFFNNDNDPYDQSSYFAASNHGTGRTEEAVERGNDGQGSIGVCPHCQFMPVRVWDTFVSDGDTFGLGIFYATHMGVKVIEGADGNLYHSKFTEAASQYAYKQGVTQTYSGDDLNTANHNYPANYNHVMEIQGTVPDTVGLGQNQSNEITAQLQRFVPSFGTAAPPGTYFRGANTTQFGGHSSISMEGPTGSVNTGKASGALALVIAAAKDHVPSIDLNADEAREIVEQTAEDVLPGNTAGTGNPDPSFKGWDSHFGWGRADVGAAVKVAHDGKIPPEASIDSPDWYAPVHGQVHITGLARAAHAAGGNFHWKLETCQVFQVGTGESGCATASEGDASGTKTDFGTINADQFANSNHPPDTGGPTFAAGTDPFKGQFTVRLTVTDKGDSSVLPGVDRKILTAVNDPTARAGYPKRMGTGGEAPIRYADLNGDNLQELIVPLEDGKLHAFEPNGSELGGWPVQTQTLAQAANHTSALPAGLDPPLEPLRGAVVADIDGDGKPEVIDTAGTHLYVWEGDGKPRPGFPVSIDPNLCKGSDQSQPLHHRKCGFLASPALAYLGGHSQPPSIMASALDGHLYAFRPDGSTVPHYPVDLVDPQMAPADQMRAESINNPAIGDLDGDGKDDVVIASNESYGADSPSQQDLNGGFAGVFGQLVGQAAGGSSRIYAIKGDTGAIMNGWPVHLPGAIQSTLPLIGPGHDASLVKVNGGQRIVISTTGGGLATYKPDGSVDRGMDQEHYGEGSNATQKDTPQLNLFEYASVGDLLGAGQPSIVKYGINVTQAANLLLVGQNVPYEHYIGAYDPTTGQPLPRYPTVTDDYQFLSSSNIGKVATGRTNQILAGTGLGLLHAYDGATAQDVSGFPKVTGGWLFAPPALSDDHRIADISREGYLFEWGAPNAPACQPEWPSFRHDPHQTGNYDADGTPPAAAAGAKIVDLGQGDYRLTFKSPGDDGFCGTAQSYVTKVNGQSVDMGAGKPVAGGSSYSRTVTPPKGATAIDLLARDEAGNVGYPVKLTLPGGHPAIGPLPLCTDRVAPALNVGSRGVYGSRHRIAIVGTAHDSGCAGVPGKTHSRPGTVRRVLVAVSVFVRGGCRFVDSRGRLGRKRSCHRPVFVAAHGAERWSARFKGRYPHGVWVVRFRAYDSAGNVVRPRPRRFRVR